MKYRLLDLFESVPDGSPLRVGGIEEVKMAPAERLTEVKCSRFCAFKDCLVVHAKLTPEDCTKCYAQEIVEGELVSDSGKTYPISGGIPRLLSGSTAEFLRKNQKSFSLEWKYFRFGERNWGMDIESRKSLFLKALGRAADELKGKIIFDAGCGSGLLSMEMANSFGMEVVALDLATGIEKAYAINRNPFVYYVQGSVLEPPVRGHAVDYIYCAGVLIHLQNTKEGFDCLPRCLSSNGRLFVWVYHSIEHHRQTGGHMNERLYDWLRRAVTSKLPISVQEGFYRCLLIPYFLKRAVLNPRVQIRSATLINR